MDFSGFQPMLSAKIKTPKHLESLRFPLLGSRKYDGIRLTKLPGVGPVTRKPKLVPNRFVQNQLAGPEYDHLDFEIVVGPPNTSDTYRTTMSAVMSEEGEPDFHIYVFDHIQVPTAAYQLRQEIIAGLGDLPRMTVTEQRLITNLADLMLVEEEFYVEGYEGIMARQATAGYKFGRSTMVEQGLVAWVRYETIEAQIIGFEELEHNDNEAMINGRGRTERTSHKANKRLGGTLGALILKCDRWPDPFNCGTGFSSALRKEIWENRPKWMNLWATLKFRPYGSFEAPRFPIYKAIRHPDDMS